MLFLLLTDDVSGLWISLGITQKLQINKEKGTYALCLELRMSFRSRGKWLIAEDEWCAFGSVPQKGSMTNAGIDWRFQLFGKQGGHSSLKVCLLRPVRLVPADSNICGCRMMPNNQSLRIWYGTTVRIFWIFKTCIFFNYIVFSKEKIFQYNKSYIIICRILKPYTI